MDKYHKIQTVFLRNPETKFKTLLEGQWAKPEFGYLADLEWVGTEKIDGANIRVIYDGNGKVEFRGKTDEANIPPFLLDSLKNNFTVDKLHNTFEGSEVCIYGEGFGNRIQSAGKHYIPDATDFILFDIKIGDFWLRRENTLDIATNLEVCHVPVVFKGTLREAVEYAKVGFNSLVAHNSSFLAEGLILTPEIQLFDRMGDRVITKIKYKDFAR